MKLLIETAKEELEEVREASERGDDACGGSAGAAGGRCALRQQLV